MASIVLIRGAGDLASGVALRLHRAGLIIAMTELHQPLAVRRTVSFAEAIYEGHAAVEGLVGRSVRDPMDKTSIQVVLEGGEIPVIEDPEGISASALEPLAIVDGRMLKTGPAQVANHALLHIGLGPGFVAPVNCDVVIETERGHTLGRPIWRGSPLPDTMTPVGDPRRILRAPTDGVLESTASIGQRVENGTTIASIGGAVITAPFAGVLRGLLRPGSFAPKGMKIGDVDPRGDEKLCELVSDKSLAIGGGVLEALLTRPEIRAKLWS